MRRCGVLVPWILTFVRMTGVGVRAFLSVVLMLAGRRGAAALRFGALGPDFRQDDGDGVWGCPASSVILTHVRTQGPAALRSVTLGPDVRRDDGRGDEGRTEASFLPSS